MFVDPGLMNGGNANLSGNSIVKLTETVTDGELTTLGGDCENKVGKGHLFYCHAKRIYHLYIHI